MDALRLVEEWPVDHSAVGVVVLDTGRDRPPTIGPPDRSFPWASVTKPVTALAVLVAVEEGTLDLDEPAGPKGSTVRHLLAHASGLGPGLQADPPLAAPGTRRIYSNAGFGMLGAQLAERSAMSFGDYLYRAVLEPLHMTGTVLGPDLSPDAPSGPAAGLAGPLRDLLALGVELAVPSLVSPETNRAAVSVQYPDLAGVLPGFQLFDPCPWGLGVEIRGEKHPHWTGSANSPATFGHFGQSGSFLWVDPEARVVCAGLSDRSFGLWAARSWPVLADAVLAEVAGGRSTGSRPPSGWR
jgi:CubicO group peptidase (beta-lactamase class C family)